MFHRHPFLSLCTFVYLGFVGWVTLTPASEAPIPLAFAVRVGVHAGCGVAVHFPLRRNPGAKSPGPASFQMGELSRAQTGDRIEPAVRAHGGGDGLHAAGAIAERLRPAAD